MVQIPNGRGPNFVHFISDSTFGLGFKDNGEWLLFVTQLTCISKAISNCFQKLDQESVGETPSASKVN